MNCRRADQLFSAAWEDELTLVEREALEAHMAGCTSCRRAYDEFVRVMESVQGLPRVEAATDFSDAVWSRIRAAEAPGVSRARVLGGGWNWASFRPALAAAACLVVVGGAVAYWQMHHVTPQAPSVATPSRAIERRVAETTPAPAPAVPATKSVAEPTKVASRAVSAPSSDLPKESVAQKMAEDQGVSGQQASLEASGMRIAAGNVAAAPSAAKRDTGAATDTLFNHAYDVEFALDPVHLKKTGKGRLTPASPLPSEVEGKPAKVTF